MEQYEFHPLSSYFPLMEGEEFKELVEDIKENGLRNRIILYDGKILDGRNRYNACLEVQIKMLFTDYEGDDPLQYVISQNLKRRHLTASQRAAIATNLLSKFEEEAKERQKGHAGTAPGKSKSLRETFPQVSGKARDKAGEAFGVSGKLVEEAQSIKEESPEEFQKIVKGEKTVSEVKRERETTKKKQQRIKAKPLAIEQVNEEIKKTFEAFYEAVRRARKNHWKDSPKQAIRNLIENLEGLLI